MGAVIDKRAFEKISEYIDDARKNATIIAGGKADGSKGYFIEPTLVQTDDPAYRLLCEEIFGPVVTAYVYDDAKWDETLEVVDATSPYALTGAVFAQDRAAIVRGDDQRCATPPATSTSTTSRPARWSASSRSAARARRARTTRRGRSSTWCAGSARGRSRRTSSRRTTTSIRSWARNDHARLKPSRYT